MKILIIGGYGNFGKRLLNSLVNYYDHKIIIAGRNSNKADAVKTFYKTKYNKNIETKVIDVTDNHLDDIFKSLKIDIVVNASGPYQLQRSHKENYKVAKACIAAACHYIDLADDKSFVAQFSTDLNNEAKKENIMLISGASTVPGLSTAVIDEFIGEFIELKSVYYGISPGNKAERGKATIASILSYTGKPFDTLVDGKRQAIFGWQNLGRYDFGSPLGKRWMSNCEIPDLDLLPIRYPSLNTIHFQAGLEVTIMQLGLWFLSGLVRIRLIQNLARYTSLITNMSEWFRYFGCDSGGMFMELMGVDLKGQPKKVIWHLIAENGVGPNVPTIAAELVIDKIANGKISAGAMPCMGLFNLTEFFNIAKRWGITQHRIE